MDEEKDGDKLPSAEEDEEESLLLEEKVDRVSETDVVWEFAQPFLSG